MKYLAEWCRILLFWFAGELLHAWVPLPIPASIYGLLLLFTCLWAGWVRPDGIRTTASQLIGLMPLLFIPPTLGVTEHWPVIRPVLLPVVLIVVLSFLVTFGVSGVTADVLLRRADGRGGR